MSTTTLPTHRDRLPSGHRRTPLGRSPFWSAAPGLAAVGVYALAGLTWLVVGDALPGGRWFAVHLFTLGVLSNAVLTFSQHFGHTVTRSPADGARWLTVLLNIGVVATLVAMPAGSRIGVAVGATVATAAVTFGYVRIRKARRAAVGARFAWIARVYERAHGAFIHGAVLGGLLGTGLLSGSWYLPARLAHLHINILGWGVLTLLATLVFFGPTMVRTRIEPGADVTAARAIRHGATGLTVGVLALLGTGAGGGLGDVLHVVAVLGLAAFAAATVTVVFPVVTAAIAAKPSAPLPLLVGTCVWLGLAVWADVLAVAARAWPALDVLGAIAIAGILGQAIAATLTYLAPMLRGRSFGARDLLLARLETLATTRAVALNLGVLLVTLGAVIDLAGTPGTALTRAGWTLFTLAILHLAQAVLRPIPDGVDDDVRSSVAARYRDA